MTAVDTDRKVWVATSDEMAAMSDEALERHVFEIKNALASVDVKLGLAREAGTPTDSLNRVKVILERGIRVAGNVHRYRHGSPVKYEPARPVTDWVSGFHAIKAMNRLMGLAQAEHEAVAAWLADESDDDSKYEAMVQAHEALAGALAALPEVEE